MKAVGIITEYNPLHNGHIYHLNKAKELAKADICVCVMSGNFVQRGEPAVINKYLRTQAAIESGVDLVVELPTYYAISSAEGFASGAVKTLSGLFVDNIVFGSECGNIDLLSKCAKIILSEPEQYSKTLKECLAKGDSFPKARQTALKEAAHDIDDSILNSPNNILAIEYIKAIYKLGLNVTPLTLPRINSNYHDTTLTGSTLITDTDSDTSSITNSIASATAIRNNLLCLSNNEIKNYIPAAMSNIFKEHINQCTPVELNDFSQLLNYKISELIYKSNFDKSQFVKQAMEYPDMTTSLANKIFTAYSASKTFSEYSDSLKCKGYTQTRINRVLMHILLDIKISLKDKYDSDKVPYIRILGSSGAGFEYLNKIKKNVSTTVITKPSTYKDMLVEDIHAANIYNQVIFTKFGTAYKNDLQYSIYKKG